MEFAADLAVPALFVFAIGMHLFGRWVAAVTRRNCAASVDALGCQCFRLEGDWYRGRQPGHDPCCPRSIAARLREEEG